MRFRHKLPSFGWCLDVNNKERNLVKLALFALFVNGNLDIGCRLSDIGGWIRDTGYRIWLKLGGLRRSNLGKAELKTLEVSSRGASCYIGRFDFAFGLVRSSFLNVIKSALSLRNS